LQRHAQYKCGDACGDSCPRSYEACVISVRNWVHGRVRSSDGLKRSLRLQCEEEGPERVPLEYRAGGYSSPRHLAQEQAEQPPEKA
jgi:hypothetical protein